MDVGIAKAPPGNGRGFVEVQYYMSQPKHHATQNPINLHTVP